MPGKLAGDLRSLARRFVVVVEPRGPAGLEDQAGRGAFAFEASADVLVAASDARAAQRGEGTVDVEPRQGGPVRGNQGSHLRGYRIEHLCRGCTRGNQGRHSTQRRLLVREAS